MLCRDVGLSTLKQAVFDTNMCLLCCRTCAGNRVTLRDWLNLTVKEGLTVYREHQFMADLDAATAAVTAPYGSPDWEPQLLTNLYTMASDAARGLPADAPQSSSWRRVHEAKYLRNEQFDEDEGPLAHPIRPAHVTSLKSLYTDTVYAKVGGLPALLPPACTGRHNMCSCGRCCCCCCSRHVNAQCRHTAVCQKLPCDVAHMSCVLRRVLLWCACSASCWALTTSGAV